MASRNMDIEPPRNIDTDHQTSISSKTDFKSAITGVEGGTTASSMAMGAICITGVKGGATVSAMAMGVMVSSMAVWATGCSISIVVSVACISMSSSLSYCTRDVRAPMACTTMGRGGWGGGGGDAVIGWDCAGSMSCSRCDGGV